MTTRVASTLLVVLAASRPALAHNPHVHQPMTDFTYQVMRLAAQPNGPLAPTPGNEDPAAWKAFLAEVAGAVARLDDLPAGLDPLPPSRCTADDPTWADGVRLRDLRAPVSSLYARGSDDDCGQQVNWRLGAAFSALPLSYAGTGLGFWAQQIDDEFDDFHGGLKPTNLGNVQLAQDAVSAAWEPSMGVLLVPFVCALNCLTGLLGSCSDCVDEAKRAAHDTNPANLIDAAVPIFGDLTGPNYTGLWHFINVGPNLSNDYDDRQGMLYEEAGPDGDPGAVDLGIMVAGDLLGITVNPSRSNGVARYQIHGATDGHPDSVYRSDAQWEQRSIGHTPFTPVDNLGYYGWRRFVEDPKHSARWLAYPLHALGDATVPMHVTGTTAHGHRSYEDAQERLYDAMVGNDLDGGHQLELARQVLLRGFAWWQFIRAWRTTHGAADDVPVRDLVTALAQRTRALSMANRTPQWPFNDAASTLYFLGSDRGTDEYQHDPLSLSLGRQLLFDGQGATLAFLVAASEVAR